MALAGVVTTRHGHYFGSNDKHLEFGMKYHYTLSPYVNGL